MTSLTASSEIGGVRLELLVGSLGEALNLDDLVEALKGVLLRCPSNLKPFVNRHGEGDDVAPR